MTHQPSPLPQLSNSQSHFGSTYMYIYMELYMYVHNQMYMYMYIHCMYAD